MTSPGWSYILKDLPLSRQYVLRWVNDISLCISNQPGYLRDPTKVTTPEQLKAVYIISDKAIFQRSVSKNQMLYISKTFSLVASVRGRWKMVVVFHDNLMKQATTKEGVIVLATWPCRVKAQKCCSSAAIFCFWAKSHHVYQTAGFSQLMLKSCVFYFARGEAENHGGVK